MGGVTIPVLYAGRAGFAGEDQINFQLPANVPTGCVVSFQISVNGQLGNTTFIAIAPDANSTACLQPGFTTAQLQQFDNGASETFGFFELTQFSITVPGSGPSKFGSAAGGFIRFTGNQLAGLTQTQAQFTSTGSCIVIQVQSSAAAGSGSSPGLITASVGGLDAGTVTLNGPAGSGFTNQPFTEDPASLQYSLNLGTQGLAAGTYSVAGAGGADVGKFNTSLTIGAPLTLTGTGLPGSVTRSAGLTLNWTGDNASDLVEIIGVSSAATGTGASLVTNTGEFVCTTNAGAGTFTVPSSVLLQLPASPASATAGSGIVEFASAVSPTTFTAPLTAGGSINSGTFLSLTGQAATVAFQ